MDNDRRPNSTSDDDHPNVPINNPDDDQGADRLWGLWHGIWHLSGWQFEQVPSPATISPSLAICSDGSIAVVSSRLTMNHKDGEPTTVQSLYLAIHKPNREWTPAIELGSTEPGPTQASVVAASDDLLHILYAYYGEPLHLEIRDTDVTPRLLAQGPSAPATSTLAEGPDGRIHAVFGDWGLSHQAFDGKRWTVLNTFARGSYPELVFGPDGEGHLIDLDPRGMGDTFMLNHYLLSGDQWIGEAVLASLQIYPRPHIKIDQRGAIYILAPSSIGLLYITQNPDEENTWKYEVVAGDDWQTGWQYADIVLSGVIPVIAYRDAGSALGFAGYRGFGGWEVGQFKGFDQGFIGIDLVLSPDLAPHVVFSGWRQQ